MSLNEVSIITVIKNQFQYKLKAYIGVFTSLVVLQVLALLFAAGGNGGGGSTTGGVELSYTEYSILNVITFTFLWAFIHSIIMTTKTDWENAFIFVGNRFTHDVSNLLFLFTASVIGAILTVLSAFTMRVYVYYFVPEQVLVKSSFVLTGGEVFSGIVTMIFQLFLLCSIGYFLGTLTRMHRLLPVVVPVFIIGIIIFFGQRDAHLMLSFIEFFFEESNPFLFIMKVVVTVVLLFAATTLISSRMEVRR